ncbi:glycosyltransferase family 2 protein [Glaciecola sp. 2405UD65-10]|uniref:glycosyltransferase family 2 protein n=1 Tax=Glaciecola sp. 2405UD65-10 TaxID=3397244 RepID=UPI003B5BFA0F
MIISTLEIILACILGALSTLLCIELLLGALFFSQKQKKQSKTTSVANVILIPAHNEAQVIEKTLINLKENISPQDTIVVVADNCSDNTNQLCEAHGATVLERFSDTEKGKGYALDYGTKWILNNLKFDNLILFDADCVFTPGSYDQLVLSVTSSNKICQSVYLMQANEGNTKAKIGEFTWWLKNAIRATGLNMLHIGCHIQGSGIAFPKASLASVDFASGSIVEDLELGLKLSINKNRVLFCANSTVLSTFPENEEGLNEQRKRWEHGHLDTVMKSPQFIFKAIEKRTPRAILLILDATIPPLFAYLSLLVGLLGLGFVLSFFDHYILFNAMLTNLFALVFSLIVIWLIKGRQILQIGDIPKIMQFVRDKFSIYFSFATSKQTTWVKTTRDENKDEKNKD